jgi:bifunctional DNA-binding transcriptional regulator/antitoxin component of YhaV-PrlF toxin-antitoxin module
MARAAGLSGAALLNEVEKLAGDGYGKGEIAQRLGFKNPTTLTGRLVRASQQTGKPIPIIRHQPKARSKKRVEVVQIKRRGRGDAFGVAIPQEPLERLGVTAGDRLTVTVTGRRILLSPAIDQGQQSGPKPPRLIRKRGQVGGVHTPASG